MSEATQEIEVVDPAQVEADMLAAAEAKANDPAEQAAQLFKAYKNSYERAVAKLSSKSKTRLLKALVLAPLEKAPLVNELEHEAYYYGDSMLQAKFIMSLTVFKDSAEEIIAMQEGMKTETLYGDEAKALVEGDTNESN